VNQWTTYRVGVLILSTMICGCAATSKRLQVQVLSTEGQRIPQLQAETQFKSKRFLKPVFDHPREVLAIDEQGRASLPKVRAKGAAGWGEWALWIHLSAPGFEPISRPLAQYEHSSTTLDPQWTYPFGLSPEIRMTPSP